MYKDLSDSEMLILNLLWESKRKLKRRKAWDFVSRNYSSVKDFILALDDSHISEKEAEEIERILSKAEEKI